MPIVDAWLQHPTLCHTADPIFDSLRRWTRQPVPTQELAVRDTIAVMDAAGVDLVLTSAWYAPRNIMISNEEVHWFGAEYKERLLGVGSVGISKPMEAVARPNTDLRQYGYCHGFGTCRPRTACSTRYTPLAVTWVCPSVPRLATLDR